MKAKPAALSLALAAALSLSLHARSSAAAPKRQQCIAAAESGQQLRSNSKLFDARKAFALCTASTCPAVIRRDCGRWIEELDALIPSIQVKLVDGTGAEVAEGRVLMNGEPFQRAGDGHATPVDPGMHRFTWVRDEGSSVEEQVVVREGERNKVVELHAPVVTVGHSPPSTTTGARARGPLPFIVGGAGLALAAAGGIFWGIGLHDCSTLGATCASAHTCAQSDVEASHTKLVIGDVLLGVGVIAIVGAVYLFVTQGNDSPPLTTSSR